MKERMNFHTSFAFADLEKRVSPALSVSRDDNERNRLRACAFIPSSDRLLTLIISILTRARTSLTLMIQCYKSPLSRSRANKIPQSLIKQRHNRAGRAAGTLYFEAS